MARKINAENLRIQHAYLRHLRGANGRADATLDATATAIRRFEEYTGGKSFKSFHREQAIGFKAWLDRPRADGGAALSVATQCATLAALRRFFQWLAREPGYRKRARANDADYFKPLLADARIAKHRADPVAPTLEQMHHVIATMPATDVLARRDRAVVATILLTGCRDGALVDLQLKHLDLDNDRLILDAREVRTKAAKSFPTFFFPVGGEARAIVASWVEYLRREALWNPDDPLFPKTRIEVGPDRRFRPAGLARAHWSSATPIRAIFKGAFAAAGLPYYKPHSVRTTLARLGETLCRDPEAFKAWSQNLGHDAVMTTLTSYGAVATARQSEIIARLSAAPGADDDAEALMRQALEAMKRRKSGGAA